MMRRISMILGLGAALFALTGCPSTYPKCDNDDACKEHNEVCVQGQCQECAGDQNCKTGFVCQANQCVPKPECSSDANCSDGMKCQAGKCAYECTESSDCGQGKCVNHACVVGGCNTTTDCNGDETCGEDKMCHPKQAAEACNWDPVHFAFNDASVPPEATSQLQGLVSCIEKAPGKVVLEGNADERGTEEYNLQLSNRRAASVKKYLVDLGVPASKLGTVGYGANRPAEQGHDESAWAANRRVEFRH
jgi:peptidoglycan-associated lipoprotein